MRELHVRQEARRAEQALEQLRHRDEPKGPNWSWDGRRLVQEDRGPAFAKIWYVGAKNREATGTDRHLDHGKEAGQTDPLAQLLVSLDESVQRRRGLKVVLAGGDLRKLDDAQEPVDGGVGEAVQLLEMREGAS